MRIQMWKHTREAVHILSPRVTNAEEKLPAEQLLLPASYCYTLVNTIPPLLSCAQCSRDTVFHMRALKLLPSDNMPKSFGTPQRLQADKMCFSDKRK